MNNKRGLGRGLGALLSSTPTEADTLLEVAVDEIEPNPNQPRKIFNSNALDELSASIKASGVIQPIIVRKQGTGYQLVAGERRWRAARQAGLPRVPAIVREVTDAESLELALVENLLREDLNPIQPHGGGGSLRQAARSLRVDAGGAIAACRQGAQLRRKRLEAASAAATDPG
jgi:ParB family chromosome partitioning protein